uniref:Cupin n=1 Tax=uncultured Thiotrichaceae bacterium TaxID=298394 RepID=A0A6S6SUH8_9GAMM|nr:MAG: Cupin [uncultured Thiotrichaceae bacterium]
MNIGPFSIEKQFVVMSPDKSASIEALDSSLYQRLNDNYAGFKGHELICCYEFNKDWGNWEIHPKGDEIVVLLSGNAEFVIELETEQRSVTLENMGDYAIIPKKTWYTIRTQTKTKILFISPCEGTESKKS